MLRKLRGRFAYEFVLILLFLSILLIGGSLFFRGFFSKDDSQTFQEYVPESQKKPAEARNANSGGVTKPLPEKVTINMPFTTQAPNANWDALHEEACEEASLIMLKHYKDKTNIGSKDDAEKEIQDLVSFENENGYKVDVTTTELSQIAKDKYSMATGRVVEKATIDGIKREIASGRPVIIPAAGKLLPNPNFRSGGPLYHMLVIKGYDKDGFITNDPGTRKGEGFRYTFDALYNAIHDWDPSNILNGEKRYLVFD